MGSAGVLVQGRNVAFQCYENIKTWIPTCAGMTQAYRL